MKKNSFICLFLFFSLSFISAQNYFDVLNIKYSFLPENEFEEFKGVSVNFTNFNADLGIALTLKNKDIFLVRPGYQFFKAESEVDSYTDLRLTYIKLPIGYVHNWKNSKWTTYFEFLPKLNSDLKNIQSNHFQYGGTVLNYYKKSEKLSYQVGIFYNGETYGPFIVPLLGIEWKPDSNTYINVLLPSILQIEFKLAKKIYAGFETELTGETYRLGVSDSTNSFISNFGENKLTFLVKSRLFADFYLSEHLVIFVKPGFRLFQKYEQFSEDDNILYPPERFSGNLKNSFYCELGLALRFRN